MFCVCMTYKTGDLNCQKVVSNSGWDVSQKPKKRKKSSHRVRDSCPTASDCVCHDSLVIYVLYKYHVLQRVLQCVLQCVLQYVLQYVLQCVLQCSYKYHVTYTSCDI